MLVQKESLQRILSELKTHNELSLDCETSGLEEKDLPFGFSIANQQGEFYFDERELGSEIWLNKDLHNLLCCGTWILQNAKFDLRMLAKRGLQVKGKIEDIGVKARLVKNNHFEGRPYSLAAQATRHGLEKLSIVEEYIKEHNLYEERTTRLGEKYKVPRFDWVPLDVMSKYAAHDARITFDLNTIYNQTLDEGSRKVMSNESRVTEVCLKMEQHGIQTNSSYIMDARRYELLELTIAKEKFEIHAGKPFVSSAKSLCPLFEKEGEKIYRTAAGNLSLTDDILETYTSPAARLVQKIRHHEKRISTYYDNYLNMMDNNGIIRPSMHQYGTSTGRFSYSDPNLQNIPKEEEESEKFSVRGCFVPRNGKVFVSMDYSQMEYRIAAAYANEHRVIQEVMNGADFHQATADMVGIPRSSAKTLNFAVLYGAGPPKIARMLGITTEEAKRLRTKYFMGLPRIEHLIDKVITTGKHRGYVVNWLGRKLYAKPDECYALPNHLIQSSGADVCKVAMVKIHDTFPNIPMVLQIHDQLVFEMSFEDYPQIPKIVKIMEEAFPIMNGMQLKVDVSWSPTSLSERDMRKGSP
jgi:DNA polymerase I